MLKLKLTNIYNDNKTIYLFHRPDKKLETMKDESLFPYYYEPSPKGLCRGYFGEKLEKIVVGDPYQISKKRTNLSQEADINFCKRYLLDKVSMDKAELRFVFWDIETQSKNMPDALYAPDPITCITTYDNYTKEYKQFWTLDYKSEFLLIDAFITYIRSISPDLLIGYNSKGFDYPYMTVRYANLVCDVNNKLEEKLSPIGKMVKRNGFPAGLSILDYYEMVKKVYKFKKWKLEYIYCATFKKEYKPEKFAFHIIDAKIKDKNLNDVKMLVELENKFHLINYFDELRRIGKVMWDDLCMNSVIVDGVILQTAKEKGVILPSKPDEDEKFRRTEEDEIIGGYVYAKTGLHKGVHLFDVGGTYPNLIITFNLDPVNVKKEPNTQTVTVNKVNVWQNTNAIVPTVCRKMVNSREEIQKLITTLTGEEKDLMKQKDAAIKGVNNTVYGTLLFKSSRMYNKDIASTITYLARFLIRYTKLRLKTFGYEVIMADTDSVFVKTDEDAAIIQSMINEQIIPEFLNHFGKTTGTLKFKYEGTFSKLFISAKKHYMGDMIGKDEPVIKGVEVLRSDSSKFMEKFQEELLKKILNETPKEEIDTWMVAEETRMKALPLIDVAFPCKLSKSPEAYKVETIHIRALRYALMEHPDWQVSVGTDFYYTYIIPEKFEIKTVTKSVKKTKKDLKENPSEELTKMKTTEVKKYKEIMAFDDFVGIGDNKPDWNLIADRNIWKKATAIYEAMGWKLPHD